MALMAGFCSTARAERDADFAARLRQAGFTQLADIEIDRLLAKPNLTEDTRVALMLEKARILELKAVAAQLDEAAQIDLIRKAQDVLNSFISRYASRPEKTDASYELQFLNRVLGLLYVRQAQYQSDEAARDDLIARGRAALDQATAGYGALRGEFEKRRDELKAEQKKQQDLYDAEVVKLKPDRAVMRAAERLSAELADKISAAEFSAIQCRYLEADSTGGLGRALKKIAGREAEGDALLDKAMALYNALFNDYKATPYIEVAYRSVCESVRMQCAKGQAAEALKRIQAEINTFLTTYREEMKKEPVFRRIAGHMRLVAAEAYNALGKYKEARDEAGLASRDPLSTLKDEADIEVARSYKGEGDINRAATMLAEVIAANGSSRKAAIDLVLEWLKENPAISAKFPAETQFMLAMLLYNARRHGEAGQILAALAGAAGPEEAKWAPASLLYIAQCRVKEAEMKKAQLAGAGNGPEGAKVYLDGLKNAVAVIMEQLVTKYSGLKTPEGQAVLKRALYLALDWQSQVLRLENEKEQKARMESILAAFNAIFPGAANIPDANYLRGVGLETEGKYQEAIDAYKAVAPDRNQGLVAKLRVTLCEYRLYRQGKAQPVEEFQRLWSELSGEIEQLSAKLNDPAAKLEENEKTQFNSGMSEGEYTRMLMLFYANEKETAAALGEGAKKARKIIELAGPFPQKYPDSAYQGQVTFMLARSRIENGEGEAAEADVEKLKDRPDLYQNALGAIRDSYFNLHIEARKKNDAEAAKKYGEKFITFATRFAQAFPNALTAGDKLNMGDYLYQAGRTDEAAVMLTQAWEMFEEGFKSGKYNTPDAAARARAALRVIGERLGDVLLGSENIDKFKKAGEVYARLLELRKEDMRPGHKNAMDLEKAFNVDGLARHYMARRAMTAVAVQALAGGEMPDMDSLVGAVDVLAGSARMLKALTREWWLTEYWMARGLLTQRDYKTAAKVCDNVRAISVGFKAESGAGETAFGGKTFKALFEGLAADMANARKPPE